MNARPVDPDLDAKALAVLARTRARVEDPEGWVQRFWSVGTRCCLHTILAGEVRRETNSGMPTPLDGRVFHAVWGVLPEWAESSISRFNDSWDTQRSDVLAVIDAAAERLRSTSAPPKENP